MSNHEYLQHFAEFKGLNSSPVYAVLGPFIAAQPEMLRVAENVPMHKSPSTVFLAAVHVLLLSGVQHHLAEFYPTLGGTKTVSVETEAELCSSFLDFYNQHREKLISFLHNNTQTNEVKRCCSLLPALERIAEKDLHEIAFIEIGTSAGLLLNLDQYHYQLSDITLGKLSSPLLLATQWQGDTPKKLMQKFPHFKVKIGVDLNPLDIENEDTFLWLQALIWPEHTERMKNLMIAREIFVLNKSYIHLLKGELSEHISKIVNLSQECDALCFVCVWVLYQLSSEQRAVLDSQLSEMARIQNKKIFFICDTWELSARTNHNSIILREYDKDGSYQSCIVCDTQHHGNWINLC